MIITPHRATTEIVVEMETALADPKKNHDVAVTRALVKMLAILARVLARESDV
jgi:hypothetical protein